MRSTEAASSPRRSERQRMLLFLLSGGLNTLLASAAYFAVLAWTDLGKVVALVADYGLGIVSGYLLHRWITFGDVQASARSLARYALAGGLSFLVHWPLLHICADLLGMGARVGFVVSLGLTLTAFYLVQKFWVFRPAE